MTTKVIEVKAANSKELAAIITKVIEEALSKSSTKNNAKETVEMPKLTIHTAILDIATKMGWKPERVDRWLYDIAKLCPVAALNIVLKELAIELDKKYEGYIGYSDEIYVISTFNGEITKVKKDCIKSYKHFAAFRTLEDAQMAYLAVKPHLDCMFEDANEQKG
jgi:hypothetical protein